MSHDDLRNAAPQHEIPDGEEVPGGAEMHLDARTATDALAKLRRRLMRGLDLQRLEDVARLHERLIRESVAGHLSKKNADVLSRIVGRHGELVGKIREDQHREAAIGLLRAQGDAPALPNANSELFTALGIGDLVDASTPATPVARGAEDAT